MFAFAHIRKWPNEWLQDFKTSRLYDVKTRQVQDFTASRPYNLPAEGLISAMFIGLGQARVYNTVVVGFVRFIHHYNGRFIPINAGYNDRFIWLNTRRVVDYIRFLVDLTFVFIHVLVHYTDHFISRVVDYTDHFIRLDFHLVVQYTDHLIRLNIRVHSCSSLLHRPFYST